MPPNDKTTTPNTIPYTIREAQATDIAECYEIESASYPEDEAATLEKLKLRQSEAQPFFRICYIRPNSDDDDDDDEEVIVGFVCATLCKEFSEESMSVHDASGDLLAIHSVVVREEYRRQKYATKMLLNYVSYIREVHSSVRKLVLIAKRHLLRFYVHCGFRVLGLSDIEHGE